MSVESKLSINERFGRWKRDLRTFKSSNMRIDSTQFEAIANEVPTKLVDDDDIVFLPGLPNGDPPRYQTIRDWADLHKFVEDLIHKRFAFLVTLLGAVLAGWTSVKAPPGCAFLSTVGFTLAIPLTAAVNRSYAKASFVIAVLNAYKYPPFWVTGVCFRNPKGKGFRGCEALGLVSRVSANTVLVVLFAMSVYAGLMAWSHRTNVWDPWSSESTTKASADDMTKELSDLAKKVNALQASGTETDKDYEAMKAKLENAEKTLGDVISRLSPLESHGAGTQIRRNGEQATSNRWSVPKR